MSKIWVGSFFERFGTYKMEVLTHTDERISSGVVEYLTRPYIDTEADRAGLVAFVGFVAAVTGFTIDPVHLVDREATEAELWHEEDVQAEAVPTYVAGTVYLLDGNFVTMQPGEEPPVHFDNSWEISARTVELVAEGAVLSVSGEKLIVTKVAE